MSKSIREKQGSDPFLLGVDTKERKNGTSALEKTTPEKEKGDPFMLGLEVKKKETVSQEPPVTSEEDITASQDGTENIVPSPSPSPSEKKETKKERHLFVESSSAIDLMNYNKIKFAKTIEKFAKNPLDIAGNFREYNAYSQSREAKAGKIITDIVEKGEFNKDDINYLVKVAPVAAQQIMGAILPNATPQDVFSRIDEFISEGGKLVDKEMIKAKVGASKALENNVNQVLSSIQIDPENLQNDQYATQINEGVVAQKNKELGELEKQYPVKKVQKVSGRTGYWEDERAKEEEYVVKKAEVENKYSEIQNRIGLSKAFSYAKANSTITPLEIGEQWLKYAQPDTYKLWLKAGKKGAINRDIAEVGVRALYATEKPGIVDLAKADEANLDFQYPDKIISETYHRLGAELYKDQNWVFNAAPSVKQLDKAAEQLPEKNREIYKRFIREYERKNIGTDVPMSGLLNKVGEGVASTATETWKGLGDLLNIRSDKKVASEALNEGFDTDFKDVGTYGPAVSRLKELNKKQTSGEKLSSQEINEKQDLETYTGVRSTGQEIIDGTGNLTGQVIFQALGTKGLGSALNAGVKAAGLLKVAPIVSGLATEEAIASRALNFGISKEIVTDISASAIAFASSYDAAKRDAFRLMPDDKDAGKRTLYATIVGGLNAGTERIFKDEKVLTAFNKEISPSIRTLVNKLSEGEISKEALAPAITKLLKNAAVFGEEMTKANLKESTEELATSVGQSVATAILAPTKFNAQEAFDDAVSTFTTTFLHGGLVSSAAAINGVRANHISIPTLAKLGVDQKLTQDTKDFINAQVLSGNMTQEEANGKIKILNTASKINTEVIPQIADIAPDLPQKAKEKYSVQLLNEKILSAQAEETKDPVLKSTLEQKVKESEKIRKQILNKEVFVDDNYSVASEAQINAIESGEGLTPEEVVIRYAKDGKLSVYNQMVNDNPDLAIDVLRDVAQQIHGITSTGDPLEGGSRKGALSLQFSTDILEAAENKFPTPESTLSTVEEGKPEIVFPARNDDFVKNREFFSEQEETQYNKLMEAGEKYDAQKMIFDRKKEIRDKQKGIKGEPSIKLQAGDSIENKDGRKGEVSQVISEGYAVKIGDQFEVWKNEEVTKSQEGTMPEKGEPSKEDSITIGEMVDKKGNYKGQRGQFIQDGQAVVFKVENSNREYELGNIDEIRDESIGDYEIEQEKSIVDIDEAGKITVRGAEYVNPNEENPLKSIIRDEEGDVVSVKLHTTDGKSRTFRGQVAEDLAYQLTMNQISKNNETRELEEFINTDEQTRAEIVNEQPSEIAEEKSVADSEPISRPKIKKKQSVNKAQSKSESITKEEKKPPIKDDLSKQLKDLLSAKPLKLEGIDAQKRVSFEDIGLLPTDTIEEAIDKLIAYGGEFTEIFQAIKSDPNFSKLKLELVDSLEGDERGLYHPNGADKGRLLQISDKSNVYYTAAHELLHFFTLDSKIAEEVKDTPAYKALEDLFNFISIKKEKPVSALGNVTIKNYGLTNVKEFMSEMFINPEFREYISDVFAENKDEIFKQSKLLKESKSGSGIIDIIADLFKELFSKIFSSNKSEIPYDEQKSVIDNAVKLATNLFFNKPKIPFSDASVENKSSLVNKLKEIGAPKAMIDNVEKSAYIEDLFNKDGSFFEKLSVGGVFSTDNPDTIYINDFLLDLFPKSLKNHAIIHETVHYLTEEAIQNYSLAEGERPFGGEKIYDQEAYKSLDYIKSIYDKVSKGYLKSLGQTTITPYGFTNLSEFIAEFISNKSFRSIVDRNLTEGKSALNRILDAIKNFISSITGINIPSSVNLEELNKINDSIESVYARRKDFIQKKEEIRKKRASLSLPDFEKNKIVSDFIKSSFEKGETEADIKNALLDNGFSEQESQDFIDNNKPPAPPNEENAPEEESNEETPSGIKKSLISNQLVSEVNLNKISDKDMMSLGRKILDTGEVKPEALVKKILKENVGVLTPAEVVGMITYKADLDNNLKDAYKQFNEKQDSGEDLGTLGVEIADLEQKIHDFDVAAVITANQQSMAFRLRQYMLDRDYNVVTQIEKYKKNNNGYIPPEVEAKFRELDKELNAVKDKLTKAEKKLSEKEEQQAVDNIKESIDREKLFTEEQLQEKIKEGVQKEIDAIHSKLSKEKQSLANRAIKALDKFQKKLRGKNYSDVTGIIAFIDSGITVIKNAIKAGVAVADAVEMGIDRIKELMAKKGITTWAKEDDFRKDMIEGFEAEGISTSRKPKDKPTINDDGSVSIPNQMLRDLVSRGLTTIEELTDAVHEQVVKDLPTITKRQVRDYITDYGRKINPSADEIQKDVNTAKRIGRLLSELEDLQNKKRKEKNPSARYKISQKEKELRRKIKALDKELPISDEEKLEKAEKKLETSKEKIKSRIQELEERIKNKDFAKAKKVEPLKDDELLELEAKKEKLQNEFDKEQYKIELKNRPFWKKVEDVLLELTSGLVRGLVASVDLSAGLVQGLWRLFSNPINSINSFGTMLKHLVSEKGSQEYMDKLKASPGYNLMKASKLALDDKNEKVSAKEGLFISNWINLLWDHVVARVLAIPSSAFTKGDLSKGYNIAKKLNPYEASKRAFDGYVNSIRVQSFVQLAKQLDDKGYTYEADPEVFQKAADFVNTTTGRGSLGAIENSSRWLNILLFAPRKVVSEIKLFTPYAFKYYAQMPPAVRRRALINLSKFLIGFVGVNSLLWAALKKDDDDEDNFWNTNSSDFLTHKIGNKRFSIAGGAKSMITFLSRFYTGRFTDQYGKTTKLGERYGKPINTRFDLTVRFILGKASPAISVVAKKMDEKKGLEVDDSEIIQNLTVPMWMQDMKELYKDDPVAVGAILSILGFFGANIRTVKQKEGGISQTDLKDPVFKYFIDRGAEMPESKPGNVEIQDEEEGKIKKLTEYGEDKIKEFNEFRTESLKEELKSLQETGYVYVDKYGRVSLSDEDGDKEEKSLEDLSSDEWKKAMSIVGSKATKKAKQETFQNE